MSNREIREEFLTRGLKVSRYLIEQMLKVRGYCKRSLIKNLCLSQVEHRDEQFQIVNTTKNQCIEQGIPIFSLDTKAKELIGLFFRKGLLYSNTFRKAWDHDFKTFAKGIIVPHGIYDIQMNIGYLSIGTSMDTSEFVRDNFFHFWSLYIKMLYPNADTIVFLCDCGGSNSCNHKIFKQQLIILAKMIHMNIRVVHYPPYCSKYNPIEHRMFSQITRGWSGHMLTSAEYAASLANKVTTTTGLKVVAEINDLEYVKREVDNDYDEVAAKHIIHDEFLSQWNYLIKWNV